MMGEFVVLQDNPDLIDGGDTIDITLQANPGSSDLAESITSYLPGFDIMGFDVIANDHCAADGGGDYIFLEGNTRPEIKQHHFPRLWADLSMWRELSPTIVSAGASTKMSHESEQLQLRL